MNASLQQSKTLSPTYSLHGGLSQEIHRELCSELGIQPIGDDLISPLGIILQSNRSFLEKSEKDLIAYSRSLGRRFVAAISEDALCQDEGGLFLARLNSNPAHAGKVLKILKGAKFATQSLRGALSADPEIEKATLEFFSPEDLNFMLVNHQNFETIFLKDRILFGTDFPEFLCHQGLYLHSNFPLLEESASASFTLTHLEQNMIVLPEVLKVHSSSGGRFSYRLKLDPSSGSLAYGRSDINGKNLFWFSIHFNESAHAFSRVLLEPNCIQLEEGIFVESRELEPAMDEKGQLYAEVTFGVPRGRMHLEGKSHHNRHQSTSWKQTSEISLRSPRERVFEYDGVSKRIKFPMTAETMRDLHTQQLTIKNSVFSYGFEYLALFEESLDVLNHAADSSQISLKPMLCAEDFRVKEIEWSAKVISKVGLRESKANTRLPAQTDAAMSFTLGSKRPLITIRDYASFCKNSFENIDEVFIRGATGSIGVIMGFIGKDLKSGKINDFKCCDNLKDRALNELRKRSPVGVPLKIVQPVVRDVRLTLRIELRSSDFKSQSAFQASWWHFFKPLGFSREQLGVGDDAGYFFGDKLELNRFRTYLLGLSNVVKVHTLEWVDARSLERISEIQTNDFEILRIDPRLDFVFGH